MEVQLQVGSQTTWSKNPLCSSTSIVSQYDIGTGCLGLYLHRFFLCHFFIKSFVDMFIYIYTYVYIHMYTDIHTCIYIYIRSTEAATQGSVVCVAFAPGDARRLPEDPAQGAGPDVPKESPQRGLDTPRGPSCNLLRNSGLSFNSNTAIKNC